MDASPASSTSKVTVTYWDPAALFDLIEPDFRSRLPLRNLHWKSPTRPLRSINSLHVDLIPYSPPPSTLTASSAPPELTRVHSTESARSTDSAPLPRSASRSRGKKEGKPRRGPQRHQIPGLRNTPYLKIYILRCDDNESYKTTQRKLLREWISTHAATVGVDGHDAFEWLIVHVVLPGTPAAAQPRSSSSTGESGSRWKMNSSTTLFDKIRSDFNTSGSSKTPAVERVVQVRIPSGNPALGTLSPPVAITATETPQPPGEHEAAWSDLIAKFKSQILASFDARVGQYEEDVRERDSQRALPGWNFCTFFVLKEGLARAFESVGLVEDALVLYDELEFGLDAIVREQRQKGEIIGGGFVGWTKEGLGWIEEARKLMIARRSGEDVAAEGVVEVADDSNYIDAEKKPYRELILSNEISVYDFRCYLFARQATLLLRLGRRFTESEAAPGEREDDLLRLAEVCQRGIEFVTSVARVLRLDLANSSTTDEEDATPEDELAAAIDNLVASWTYGVCSQLLQLTFAPALPKGLEENTDRDLLPRRTSSLMSPEAVTFAQASKSGVTGLEELAAVRAELMVLARTVVEAVAEKRGWVINNPEGGGEMVDVDLNGESGSSLKKVVWVPEGLRNQTLKEAVEDEKAFHELYAQLSGKAMNHYGVAKRFKSAERVEADLATLRFHLKDYAKAAAHLQRMTIFYAEQNWGLIETTLLTMYAQCLKELKRSEEYVVVLLKLLYKSAAAEKSRVQRRAGEITYHTEPANFSVHGYINEALGLSRELGKEIVTPMEKLWSEIVIDPYPRHLEDKDGFEVRLSMRWLLSDPLEVDKITVKLVSTSTGAARELLLESSGPLEMKIGVVHTSVFTTKTIPGTFAVERIAVYAAGLTFVHELIPAADSNPLSAPSTGPETSLKFFPSPRSLTARLEMPKIILLSQLRTVEIVISMGGNEVSSAEVRIRSATAGLRLHIASLTCPDAVVDGATLRLKDVGPDQEIRASLPYNSESDLSELTIRLEVDYTTPAGDFAFHDAISVPVALPLAVNVQDIFKREALFSKFQVCTALGEVPLRITSATLSGNDQYTTSGGKGLDGTNDMIVFFRQPACFIFKITAKTTPPPVSPKPLELVISYSNIDDEIRETLLTAFLSALSMSGLERYKNYLLPHLPAPINLESTALTGIIPPQSPPTPSLTAIPPTDHPSITALLTSVFTTSHPLSPTPVRRSIKIPVEIPSLNSLHTVDLRLRRPLPTLVAVGDPLPATLTISSDSVWSDHGNEPCTYEIRNDAEVWLISGRRRAKFDGAVNVAVTLVPTKAGVWRLPSVVIEREGDADGSEVVYCAEADAVNVGVDVRSVSVRIAESATAE